MEGYKEVKKGIKKDRIKKKVKKMAAHRPTKVFAVFIIVVVSVLFVLGSMTRAGIIENYLGWEVLCSGSENEYINPVASSIIKERERRQKLNVVDSQEGAADRMLWSDLSEDVQNATAFKPVVYLYPESEMDVKVQLEVGGGLIADYPEYDEEIGGWEVVAKSNGDLINKKDGEEYSYIFWEGNFDEAEFDMGEGFVVKGEDTREFLRDILREIGLTPREYNEFIVYWYPLMMGNEYNLIHFAGESYTDHARLTVTPEPDSVLRVFMVFEGLDEFVEVEEQIIEPFVREGFSLVEWGGTELR